MRPIHERAADVVASRTGKSDVYKRIYPIIVSFLGASGLAAGLAYFAGVYLVFQPGWEEWADFFVPIAIPLLLVPYVLLIGHLFLRTQLGGWYLRHGQVDEAIAYCEARTEHNLLRSRKEALIHRITLGRAYVHAGRYDRAEQVLASGFSAPDKGAQALDIARWRMEAALRAEDLVIAHRAYEPVAEQTRPKRACAYVRACRAELAVREGERAEYDEAIEQARWLRPTAARVELAAFLGSLRFAKATAEPGELLAVLDRVEPAITSDIPAREAELLALRAEVLYTRNETEEARQALERAHQARSDARAEYEIRRVRELLDA